MHDALVGLLDKVDTAVAESAGALRRTEVESVAALAREHEDEVVVSNPPWWLRRRHWIGKIESRQRDCRRGGRLDRRYPPHDLEPLALVPADGAGLGGYLDELGITDRVEHHAAHRGSVSSISPTTTAWRWTIATGSTPSSRVDMVVWVTDPEKYRDAVIHHRYISPMSGYQEQFLFVLNQIDRLDPEDAVVVADDLGRALREDGIRRPTVIAICEPGGGASHGVDLLMGALEAAGSDVWR